jgi:hypothetical protein
MSDATWSTNASSFISAGRGNAIVRPESVTAMPQRFVPGSIPRSLVVKRLEFRRRAKYRVNATRITASGERNARGSATATATAHEHRKFLHGRNGVEGFVARDSDDYFVVARTYEDDGTPPSALELLGERAQLIAAITIDARDEDRCVALGVEFFGELRELGLTKRRHLAFDLALAFEESLEGRHNIVG